MKRNRKNTWKLRKKACWDLHIYSLDMESSDPLIPVVGVQWNIAIFTLSPTRTHDTVLNRICVLFYWIKVCRIILQSKRKRCRRRLNYGYRIECMCYNTWQKSECREVRGCARPSLCEMNVPFTGDSHLSSLRLITQKIKNNFTSWQDHWIEEHK